jgi:hypothetical protein
MNSLSIEYDRNPEVSIKKDGMNKQCNAHTSDKDPANLSVVSCVLIIFFNKNSTHINVRQFLRY